MAAFSQDDVERATAVLSREPERALKETPTQHKLKQVWVLRHEVDQLVG